MPNYLYKNKSFNLVQIDNSRFRKKNEADNSFCLPCNDYKIILPKQIKLKDVRQVTIQRFYGKTKINIIYEEREVKKNDKSMVCKLRIRYSAEGRRTASVGGVRPPADGADVG